MGCGIYQIKNLDETMYEDAREVIRIFFDASLF